MGVTNLLAVAMSVVFAVCRELCSKFSKSCDWLVLRISFKMLIIWIIQMNISLITPTTQSSQYPKI